MAGFGADDDELHNVAVSVMQAETGNVGPTVNGVAPRLRYDGIGTGNHPNTKAQLRPWRKGESGNPLGPRAGSRHVQQAQAELRRAAPELARKAVEMGRADDAQMVRYVLDQALGRAVSRTEALSIGLDLAGADSRALLARLLDVLSGAGIDASELLEGDYEDVTEGSAAADGGGEPDDEAK